MKQDERPLSGFTDNLLPVSLILGLIQQVLVRLEMAVLKLTCNWYNWFLLHSATCFSCDRVVPPVALFAASLSFHPADTSDTSLSSLSLLIILSSSSFPFDSLPKERLFVLMCLIGS